MTTLSSTEHLAQNITEIRQRVAVAADKAGRDPEAITIVAVSKTFPRESVDAAYELGLRHFGENRVQEVRAKFETPPPDDARVHLIGPLQTNKARQAIRVVHRIETVDRVSLIETLARELDKLGQAMSVLLQVNIAGEAQKSGCAPEDAAALLTQMATHPAIRCEGLMTMAPYVADPQVVRPVFAGLRQLRDELQEASGAALPVLSMGMSGDFPIAIEEGATHVRVGRAIFGER
ncbi:MAG TPA: YggS family pyridoxal phosphate-dependent enzyme [Thermomicrobiales bacterium]|nr:YggS family pyridoxal phosphate-dependent enzyme [Thermomicrobiales bacterium]